MGNYFVHSFCLLKSSVLQGIYNDSVLGGEIHFQNLNLIEGEKIPVKLNLHTLMQRIQDPYCCLVKIPLKFLAQHPSSNVFIN
jgi:hypothetical protein